MKELFNYNEIGTLVNQGISATFTRHIQARVTVIQPSSDIETLLAMQGRSLEVVNVTENPIEDIIADFGSIFYSSCARLYGQRRAKRKTEKLIQDLSIETE